MSAAEETLYEEADGESGMSLEAARAAAASAAMELQVPIERFWAGGTYWGDEQLRIGEKESLAVSAAASRRGSVVDERGEGKRVRQVLMHRLRR